MSLRRNVFVLVLAAIVLASCGTTVALTVKRTPNMNTSGIERLAILPFTATNQSGLYPEVARVLTQAATDKILGTNHFTMVAASQIQSLQRAGQSIEDQVDATFNGQVTRVDVKNESRVVERKDKDGNVYTVTVYEKSMEIAFNYSLVRARDGSIVGIINKTGRDSSYAENDASRIRSDSQMVSRIVNAQLYYLNRDVAPYTLNVKRPMLSEKSKDKALLAKMKNINEMVKNGAYKAAIDEYLNTYDDYGNLAAGFNASVLYEATGELADAYGLIEYLAGEFPASKEVRNYMNELARVIKDQELLATEFVKGAATLKGKATALTVKKIQEVLPQGTKVWIFNNTPVANTSERKIATDVVDNVTTALIKGGITPVDRENAKLIDMEQKFQMSGAVSDNDFMSIGNAAGASVLINIGVVGTGAARRLQVQVMDMEKRTYIFRSEANDDWKI